jgi:S1-C subfamily serine protease
LAFFTGRHEDYHQPSDKFPKINVPGMRQVTQLGRDVVAALADASDRPQLVTAVPAEAHEAYFGAFGDFTRPEPGYVLGPVAKGGPADKAGLHDGDLIIRFGDSRISTDDDFNEALTHYVGGERIRIVVRRGTQLRTLDVVLGSPEPDAKDFAVPAPGKPVLRPLQSSAAGKTL